MSFQGEPSTRENCHGQTCGSSLDLRTKPRCLISATASGAGASIQSTWPESSAAVRALACGIGNSSILSTLGTRALSQYLSFFLSSSRSRGVKLDIFQGPVPDASRANAAQAACDFALASAPSAVSNSFCHFAGLAMNRLVRLMGRKLSGSLVVNSTVMSSILRAEASVGIREAVTPTWLGSNCGASCLSTFSTFQTTASALNGEPSWNVTPGRSLNVHFFLSASFTAHSVASPGIITLGLSADERSHIVRASYIVRPVKRLPSTP